MDEFLQFIGQFLFDQGYIPIRFFGAFSLGLIGFMLYSNIKEPSQWDSISASCARNGRDSCLFSRYQFIIKSQKLLQRPGTRSPYVPHRSVVIEYTQGRSCSDSGGYYEPGNVLQRKNND
jgi:hypothetical protein